MLIHRVCEAFQNAKILYAIVGGYAVALHGALRGTVDIDLVIHWTLDNLHKAENVLRKLGLVSRLPLNSDNVFNNKEDYVGNRNLIAWNFYNPDNPTEQVDIIITYDLSPSEIKSVQTKSGEIKILSKESLIRMKRKSGRPQDLQDVLALENL
ncbi:MAG: hypothetical protein K1X28_09855 [Parachlamydiales bacterium]|nr:hypothetical protein [Parachlamydiales bacterium]